MQQAIILKLYQQLRTINTDWSHLRSFLFRPCTFNINIHK